MSTVVVRQTLFKNQELTPRTKLVLCPRKLEVLSKRALTGAVIRLITS